MTTVFLPPGVHLPVTILNLLVPSASALHSGHSRPSKSWRQATAAVKRTTPLFTYSYKLADRKGKGKLDDSEPDNSLQVGSYESPFEGELSDWLVREGTVVTNAR